MAREIKFRGRSIIQGEGFHLGNYVSTNKGNYIITGEGEVGFFLVRIDPKTVGQFTGLLDKNGKEIFEGDILETTCKGWDRERCIVENLDPAGGYSFKGINGNYWDYTDKDAYYAKRFLKIIGNVFENPELLKGDA